MIRAGECLACGCTDERACPGGCIWANVTATLCSRCAQDKPAEPLGGSWTGDDGEEYYASITPEQLAGRFE